MRVFSLVHHAPVWGLVAVSSLAMAPSAAADPSGPEARADGSSLDADYAPRDATAIAAQVEDLSKGIGIGDWFFRPSIALRMRGNFRRRGLDVGGDVYTSTAVLGDGFRDAVPPVAVRQPAVDAVWGLASRARFGLSAEYHQVTGVIVLQDARLFGHETGATGPIGEFSAHQVYLDIKSDPDRPLFQIRAGRQRVQWGSGRLVGDNEWQARGGAIDGLRLWSRRGGLEVQLLGAVLAVPGALSPEYATHAHQAATNAETGEVVNREGSGAQLLGAHGIMQPTKWLGIELTGLARMARPPLPVHLTPSDAAVFDLRLHGSFRDFDYAAEIAYQTGRVASHGQTRDLSSLATAMDVAWQSKLPASLRFEGSGAYGSGDDSGGTGDTLTRFDPILPEIHGQMGQMDLMAWSNSIQASLGVTAVPREGIHVGLHYVYAGLAEPADRWTMASLIPVGVAPDNTAHTIANELDLTAWYRPWQALSFGASYSLAFLGEGGRAVMDAAGRGQPTRLHAAYVQAQLVAP